MTYFKNVGTPEELRRQYKEPLRKHHPDNGGNVADMQEINVEYDRLFRLLKDRHESHSEDSTEKQSDFDRMKYDFTEDPASVIDLCSRKITGYAYGTSMTEELPVKAVKNACLNVGNTEGIILLEVKKLMKQVWDTQKTMLSGQPGMNQ